MKIIGRKDWDNTGHKPETEPHKPNKIVVHHSWSPNAKQWKGARSMLGILNYHLSAKKWRDIGYHFVISPDGSEIYEGHPVGSIGIHCGGELPAGVSRNFGNTNAIGICVIGDYDTEQPSPAALQTLSNLIAYLVEKHGIKMGQIFGHCEAWSKPPKSCPGKNLFISLFGENRWKVLKF